MHTSQRSVVLTLDAARTNGFALQSDAHTLQITMSPDTPWADVITGLHDVANDAEIAECRNLFECPTHPRHFEVAAPLLHIRSR